MWLTQLSFEGASTFTPKPLDMSSVTLSWNQCVSLPSNSINFDARFGGGVVVHLIGKKIQKRFSSVSVYG